MRVVIVGMGIQGKKRFDALKDRVVATVDKNDFSSDHRTLDEVELDSYDVVFLCVPDTEKKMLIDYCIVSNKHCLVEKPLLLPLSHDYQNMEAEARKRGLFVYSAYNHRFEPSIGIAQKLLEQSTIGELMYINIYYGNGTSQLVRNSPWRDVGLGVISDLSPHVIDALLFWFPKQSLEFVRVESHRFENRAPDHSTLYLKLNETPVRMDLSLCTWKNRFHVDLVGSKGSLELNSLCKWGSSSIVLRERKFPAGIPTETTWRFPKGDPTWQLEHTYFLDSIERASDTSLFRDVQVHKILKSVETSLA